MKQLFILIISIVFFSGCASISKPKVNHIKRYESPKLHNADCLIDNHRYSETNLMLLEETADQFKMKASDGKILGLPISQCILSQIPLEEGFNDYESNQKWVKCSMGPMSLVTDSLIYLDDEKQFYRLKRKDGQVWVLPRVYCSIYSFNPQSR